MVSQSGSQANGPASPDPMAGARTINNLRFMALAMHNFAASNGGRFPAASICRGDQPLLSWRVAILPWLDEDALYERFRLDEAWNSPDNMSLLGQMPRVYRPVTHEGTASYMTYYQGIVGPGSFFEAAGGARVADDISVARTLMIVEAADPVPWTKPEDIHCEEDRPLPAFGGHSSDGIYVGLADGSVRLLRRAIAAEALRTLIRIGDAGDVKPEDIGPWLDEWRDSWMPDRSL